VFLIRAMRSRRGLTQVGLFCFSDLEAIMQTIATGRVRRSVAEWQTIVGQFETSGLSRVAFCKGAGIAPSTLHLRQRRLRHPAPRAEFVDVTPTQPPARWVVEFQFPDGTMARVRG
jgi:hypothetical protein